MVSIRPSDMVEGGAVPVDRNLRWTECRFTLFDYTKKSGEVVATTVAARINYQDDDGTEYVQHYSVTDPERFQPSEDGKTLVPVGENTSLSKSSNFYILMNALINAGFPENKLGEDISVLDGLYTHNIGIPEPKRAGLQRVEPAEGARERVLSVPDQLLEMPGEKKGKASTKKAAAITEPDEDTAANAVALVTQMLADNESVTRQQVATAAIKAKQGAVAKLVYLPGFAEALASAGYVLDGETITAGE